MAAVETITTVLAPAAAPSNPNGAPAGPYDLVDLATVKDELDIQPDDTAQDTRLARAITEQSIAIASYCNRVFAVETVQDIIWPERDAYPYQVPGGVAPLQLRRWPVANFTTVLTSAATQAGPVLPLAPPAGAAIGMPVGGPNIPAGATVAALGAGSVTLSAPVAGDVPAGSAITFGLGVTIVDPPGVVNALAATRDFLIDPSPGWLTRLNLYTGYPTSWDPVMTTVVYSAGYSPIPADLSGAALRMVTARWAARGRDPLLISRDQPGALGAERYWVGGVPGVRGAFPQEIAAVLDLYRVPVTA